MLSSRGSPTRASAHRTSPPQTVPSPKLETRATRNCSSSKPPTHQEQHSSLASLVARQTSVPVQTGSLSSPRSPRKTVACSQLPLSSSRGRILGCASSEKKLDAEMEEERLWYGASERRIQELESRIEAERKERQSAHADLENTNIALESSISAMREKIMRSLDMVTARYAEELMSSLTAQISEALEGAHKAFSEEIEEVRKYCDLRYRVSNLQLHSSKQNVDEAMSQASTNTTADVTTSGDVQELRAELSALKASLPVMEVEFQRLSSPSTCAETLEEVCQKLESVTLRVEACHSRVDALEEDGRKVSRDPELRHLEVESGETVEEDADDTVSQASTSTTLDFTTSGDVQELRTEVFHRCAAGATVAEKLEEICHKLGSVIFSVEAFDSRVDALEKDIRVRPLEVEIGCTEHNVAPLGTSHLDGVESVPPLASSSDAVETEPRNTNQDESLVKACLSRLESKVREVRHASAYFKEGLDSGAVSSSGIAQAADTSPKAPAVRPSGHVAIDARAADEKPSDLYAPPHSEDLKLQIEDMVQADIDPEAVENSSFQNGFLLALQAVHEMRHHNLQPEKGNQDIDKELSQTDSLLVPSSKAATLMQSAAAQIRFASSLTAPAGSTRQTSLPRHGGSACTSEPGGNIALATHPDIEVNVSSI